MFATDFKSAFDKLESDSTMPQTVSLVKLRAALPQYSRTEFDAGLIALRKQRRYSLSAVEGRFPLTRAERDAVIVIDDTPHLLVLER